MVAKRNSKAQAGRSQQQRPPQPAPGAEWGDEEDFERFWGKSLDEMAAEWEREDAEAGERTVYMSTEEFLVALRQDAEGIRTRGARVRFHSDEEMLAFLASQIEPHVDL
jgi:hypothetical protein